MNHGNDMDKETTRQPLKKQFGAGTINLRQMGDAALSRHAQNRARENFERARNIEDRGYAIQQMG